MIVGLAPAAHGGNRTGRIFTGDRSGDWLYRTLHRYRFASQPTSTDRNDGLELIDCYITAALHCAPPQNKPSTEEEANCRPFLIEEWRLLTEVRVVVALGKLAFDAIWTVVNGGTGRRKPAFRHGLEVEIGQKRTLLASYHPSQQNTFTGKLTEPMFDAVFLRCRQLLSGDQTRSRR
jgi:uracil-DNA glycosylase family 4